MSEYRNTLKGEFQDEAYRYAYAEDFLNTSIATQIRVLREQRNDMTQAELAEKIGTKQAGISRLENVNYSAWKTGTLRKLARALGVRLRITFETFGTLLDEAGNFSKQSLQRTDFEHDPAFNETLERAGSAEALTVADNIVEAHGKTANDLRVSSDASSNIHETGRIKPGRITTVPAAAVQQHLLMFSWR